MQASSVYWHSLLSISSVHPSAILALPEGEPIRTREAGDLGPAKAESPALFFCCCAVTPLCSAGKPPT